MSVKVESGFWWTRNGKLAFVGYRGADGRFAGWIVGYGMQIWSENGIVFGQHHSIQDLVEFIGPVYPGVNERPKPEPKWVPWSFEDDLLGVEIKSKNDRWRGAIVEQDIFNAITVTKCLTYINLFENYVQLDGTLCGKQVKE